MSFTSKYFSGTVSGGGSGYNYTSGAYTATLSADANEVLSGTWNFTGTYAADGSSGTDPYVRNGSGTIAFSGSLTGSLLAGYSNSWKVFFTSSDSRFVAGTYGFLDRSGEVFTLDAAIGFDLPFVNRVNTSITERFSGFNHHLAASALPPIISIDTYSGSVHEYADSITVTLSRSGADLGLASTVCLSTDDGAAASSGVAKDFNAVVNREVVFAAGVTSVTVTLGNLVINDEAQEVNENFHIRLSDPVNAGLGFATGDITILDDDMTGTSGADTLTGSTGNDAIRGGAGNDSVDGGAGLDTAVYSGNRSNFTITQSGAAFIVTDTTGANGTDTLTNVERLVFADGKIALDLEGAAGQTFRLYQAAFARAPDVGGLTYWTTVMDNGAPLAQVASGFTGSAEFQGLYGVNPTNDAFVVALYSNVLHRTPDGGGYAYWINQLASGVETKEQVLIGFSESAENHANVVGVIQNGITLNLA